MGFLKDSETEQLRELVKASLLEISKLKIELKKCQTASIDDQTENIVNPALTKAQSRLDELTQELKEKNELMNSLNDKIKQQDEMINELQKIKPNVYPSSTVTSKEKELKLQTKLDENTEQLKEKDEQIQSLNDKIKQQDEMINELQKIKLDTYESSTVTSKEKESKLQTKLDENTEKLKEKDEEIQSLNDKIKQKDETIKEFQKIKRNVYPSSKVTSKGEESKLKTISGEDTGKLKENSEEIQSLNNLIKKQGETINELQKIKLHFNAITAKPKQDLTSFQSQIYQLLPEKEDTIENLYDYITNIGFHELTHDNFEYLIHNLQRKNYYKSRHNNNQQLWKKINK